MKNIQINIIKMLVIILIFCVVIFAMQNVFFSYVVEAANTAFNFDNTDVLEDLKSSKVDGQGFDLRMYPYAENGAVSIVNFVEYCYSYRANANKYYALYVYLYNPVGVDIEPNSGQNKIEMASRYNSKNEPVYYEKFNLKFCGKSTGDYNNLFYKFKVIDHKVDGKNLYQRVNQHERRYDISGIELKIKGNTNATDYGVGGIYKFTGYVAGYGPNDSDVSTLQCVVEDLDTACLKVYHTNYRTGVSNLGKNHYNNIDTVYFSVSDELYKKYGSLQKIHAEWWEYKIKPALVSSNKEFIEYIKPYRFNHLCGFNPIFLNYPYKDILYDKTIPYNVKVSSTLDDIGFVFNYYLSANSSLNNISVPDEYELSRIMANVNIPLMYYSENTENIDAIFDFLYKRTKAGDVESWAVKDEIYNFSQNADEKYGFYDCNGRLFSKDLFESAVDSGRVLGYNNITIDFDDTFDLKSYESNHSWIEKLISYGFSTPKIDDDCENVLPIYELKASDLLGTVDSISSKLLINKNDVEDLRAFYATESLKNNHIILFRFANTDYYCAPADCGVIGLYDEGTIIKDNYIVQETIFLDFDIIDLTFNRDGVYRVIPAVASPIDVINGFTAPPPDFELWKLIIGLIIGLLIFCLLSPILIPLLKLIWSLVKSLFNGIFRGIGAFFRGMFGGKNKTKNKKNQRRVPK